MNNTEYAKAVDESRFPPEVEVPIDEGFADDRGEICNLLLTPITSVAEIVSKRGSVRANHYHKTDWHYAYVAKGEVLYFERPIGSTEVQEPQRFGPGQMFFTRPMVEHAMLFTEESTIYTFAKNVRDHDTHEADLVRVEFITPALVDKYLP